MNEDRRKILDMLAEGKIDADASERLLDRLADLRTDAARTELMPVAPRFLRIQGHADGAEFDIRIPLALIKTGIKLEAMLPDQTAEEIREHGIDFAKFSGMDADELVAALAELAVSVDGDKGEQIRIHCE